MEVYNNMAGKFYHTYILGRHADILVSELASIAILNINIGNLPGLVLVYVLLRQ